MTQEQEDRIATLDAAYRALDAEARIYPIVIQPIDYTRILTTMPAVQAITGVPGTIGQPERLGRCSDTSGPHRRNTC
jgi:hypothetical protein